MSQKLTIEQVQEKLTKIKKMGYVKSLRKGPTGIGYTLETLLGIEENNISSPDLKEIELKAKRENDTGMITLFTFNKKSWEMDPLTAIKKYGSRDKDERLGMYYTMGITPNSAGLFLYVDNEIISVRSVDGDIITTWQLSEIKKRFEVKVKNVLLVKAKVEERDGVEYFLFNKAQLLSHGTSEAILKSQFDAEHLLVDLRLHDKGTMARNHGTGFRVLENHLDKLYERIEQINF